MRDKYIAIIRKNLHGSFGLQWKTSMIGSENGYLDQSGAAVVSLDIGNTESLSDIPDRFHHLKETNAKRHILEWSASGMICLPLQKAERVLDDFSGSTLVIFITINQSIQLNQKQTDLSRKEAWRLVTTTHQFYLMPIFIIGIAIDLRVEPTQLHSEELFQVAAELRLIGTDFVDGVHPL